MRCSTLRWALFGCVFGCQFPDYAFLPCEPSSPACAADLDGPAPLGDSGADVLTNDAGDACPPPIGFDSFSREGTGGFGPADVGGSWTVTNKGNASVSGGKARVVMNAGGGSEAVLDQLSVLDVDETFVFTTDKPCAPSDGGASGIFVYLHGRKVSAGSYWIVLWLTESNAVRLGVTRFVNGKEDSLELSPDVFGIAYTAGMRLRVRARFEGVSPTKISGRVWKDGESEPAGWTVEGTDSTPELQAPGALAIKAYLSVRATNAPVTVTFDDFVARPPGSCTN